MLEDAGADSLIADWKLCLEQFGREYKSCATLPVVRSTLAILDKLRPEDRPIVLPDLVSKHIEFSWEKGQRAFLEDYVSQLGPEFPEFASLSAVPSEVIVAEYIARHEQHAISDHPSRCEYEKRFAGRADVRDALAELCLNNRFVLLRTLGVGGQGIVWAAYDLQLKRHVAIKRPKPLFADQAEFIARHEVEAQFTAGLEHPAIVAMHEIYHTADGEPFYAMRLLNNKTMSDAIRGFHQRFAGPSARRTPDAVLAHNGLLQALTTACEAVGYAHNRGILHRDLKPANIRLGQFGEVTVLDWGLAEKGRGCAESGAVQPDEESDERDGVAGTTAYMAPERSQGQPGTVQSDVFSLGATLYEISTGRPPFAPARDERATAFQRRARRGEFTPPRALNADTPQAIEAIALKALAADPAKRFPSAAELSDEVSRFLADEPVKCYREALAGRAARWMRRHRAWTASGIGAVIVVLVASVFGFLANTQRQRAVEREDTNQRYLYAARLRSLKDAVTKGRTDQLADVLAATRTTTSDQTDLRGWEWLHLYRRYRSEAARFEQHSGSVEAVTFLKNGSQIATADSQGTILIWDADTGKQRQQLLGFDGAVAALAVSPDGQLLAAAGSDTTAAIFDLRTGRETHRLAGHVLGINYIAFSHNGQLIATASQDNTIKIWDVSTGNEVHTLVGHIAGVRKTWFEPDDQHLISIGDDGLLRFWDLVDGSENKEAAKRAPPTTVVSSDSRHAAYWVPEKHTLAFCDPASFRNAVGLIDFGQAVSDMSFSPDGKLLAAVDRAGTITVLDIAEKLPVAVYRVAATQVVFSADSRHIAATCADGIVRVWPAASPDRSEFVGHDGVVQRVAFDPSGRWIASGDAAGSIRVWDLKSHETVRILGKHIAEKGPEGTPESEALKAMKGQPRRSVTYFVPPAGGPTSKTLRMVYTFAGHGGEITALSFSPDAQQIASAGDKTVRLWSSATGKELHILQHPLRTTSVAFSPDGQLLATGCWDGAVRIWNVADGTEKLVLTGHDDHVEAVVFHPDGRHIASAGLDKTIRIWDLETGQTVRMLTGHLDAVYALALSATGAQLASASGDRTIRLWNFDSGALQFVLSGHDERATALVFHPTENRLFSASNSLADGAVHVWDTSIGQELVTLPAPSGGVHGIAFDPVSQRLAVTAARQFELWDAADKTQVQLEPARPSDLTDQHKPVAARTGGEPLKALGWRRMAELPRMYSKNSSLIRPLGADREFLMAIVSVPRGLLYPTDKEFAHLIQNANADPGESLPVATEWCTLYNPARFRLVRPDGTELPATAIGPLPFALDDTSSRGFCPGIVVELGSSRFRERARALMAVVWELPSDDIPQPHSVRLDDREPVPVPEIELEDYRGNFGGGRAANGGDLLVGQSTFSIY